MNQKKYSNSIHAASFCSVIKPSKCSRKHLGFSTPQCKLITNLSCLVSLDLNSILEFIFLTSLLILMQFRCTQTCLSSIDDPHKTLLQTLSVFLCLGGTGKETAFSFPT